MYMFLSEADKDGTFWIFMRRVDGEGRQLRITTVGSRPDISQTEVYRRADIEKLAIVADKDGEPEIVLI